MKEKFAIKFGGFGYLSYLCKKFKTMNYSSKYEFYKIDPSDTIWWLDVTDQVGLMLFSFDKSIVFNLFKDYPQNLTKEQKDIFDKENPELARLVSNR